jgi:hypothetical protein
MNNYIVFQAYGSKAIFDECNFFLLRFAAATNNEERTNTTIVIYTTDKTKFVQWHDELPGIIFEPVTMEEINKWRGDIDFVHRVKIEIMIRFFSSYSGNLLYCDTDTYPVESLQTIFSNINNGAIYMHTCEGPISNNGQFRKWYNFLQTNKQLDFLKTIPVNTSMWNAGVIGLNDKYKNLLPGVLKLTDDIYPYFKKHTVEQFAFSYILQNAATVNAAENYIYHYWNLKEFRVLLESWLLSNKERGIKELTTLSKTLSPQEITVDKNRYSNLPKPLQWYKKLKGTNWKIESYLTQNGK